MSGPLVSTTPTNHRLAKFAPVTAFVVLCALACGIVVAEQPAPVPGSKDAKDVKEEPKQPAKQPTKEEDIAKKVAGLDPNNPLEADAPGRQPFAKFALDTKRLIFKQVEDGPAVAREDKNPGEYAAWCETVLWARKFTTTELEQHGARDLTPIDLHMTKMRRTLFRYELLRFDGKLVCIRRLEAPQFFKDLAKDDPNLKITELYEARFVPVDESPLTPISIVFLDLPPEFAEVATKPFREWVDKDAWISAAGFYFKTMNVPGEQGASAISVPVLVGKSFTVNKNTTSIGVPVSASGPPADPTELDRNVRLFKFIQDETTMAQAGDAEIAAYNRILIHASRFSSAELEQHAIPDLTFAHLFENSRRDYKLKNVKFEGRLIRLERMQVNPELKAAGVNQAFEGWMIPIKSSGGNPICIVFTEPLEGIEPANRLNKWVTFAGFSFKLLKYKSAQPDDKHPGENVYKRAPMLIGKGPIGRDDRDPDRPSALTWGAFTIAVIVFVFVIIVAAVGLALYYRSGDKTAKDAAETVRGRNPFASAGQIAVQPAELTAQSPPANTTGEPPTT